MLILPRGYTWSENDRCRRVLQRRLSCLDLTAGMELLWALRLSELAFRRAECKVALVAGASDTDLHQRRFNINRLGAPASAMRRLDIIRPDSFIP